MTALICLGIFIILWYTSQGLFFALVGFIVLLAILWAVVMTLKDMPWHKM